jgi:hypothetical protein
MIIPVQVQRSAWLPLTPRGVAAFAGASLARLLMVQLVFATLTAVVVVWFVSANWFPIIRAAIRQLPARGVIQSGHLVQEDDSARILAEGRFISFSLDSHHGGHARSSADIQVEFGADNVRMISLFGYYCEWTYPKMLNVAFNRSELQPWWGAWEPPLLWMGGGAAVMGLIVAGMLQATFYAGPVWLLGFFANRNLSLRASWKLAGAALMPGVVLGIVGIAGYGTGLFDLVKLVAILSAQIVVAWIFLAISPFFATGLEPVPGEKKNPFGSDA